MLHIWWNTRNEICTKFKLLYIKFLKLYRGWEILKYCGTRNLCNNCKYCAFRLKSTAVELLKLLSMLMFSFCSYIIYLRLNTHFASFSRVFVNFCE